VTIGFPKQYNTIEYECDEETYLSRAKEAKVESRGFYGKLVEDSTQNNRYIFKNPSWKEDYNGFSGSPVFGLYEDELLRTKEVVVIGVIVTIGKKPTSFELLAKLKKIKWTSDFKSLTFRDYNYHFNEFYKKFIVKFVSINVATDLIFGYLYLKHLETSVNEMKMIQEGKLQAINAKDLLDEL